MKIIAGTIKSGIVGTPEEVAFVKGFLTIDKKEGSFLSDEGLVYTGLIDFIKQGVKGRFEVEVLDLEGNPVVHQPVHVDIPYDYLKFDNPKDELRDYQILALRKAITKKRGVLEIATGGGKTEIAAAMIKYLLETGRAKKVYFVAGTIFLMKQAAARFEKRGLERVGRFGGGYDFYPAPIQCCVSDSLNLAIKEELAGAPGDGVLQDFADCDAIFFDEAHHVPSKSWTLIGETCPATYRIGLTATAWSDPFEYHHKDLYLLGLTGDVICRIPSVVLREEGFLAEPVVTLVEVRHPAVRLRQWQRVYEEGVVKHKVRNSLIVSIAKGLYESGSKCLVFVKEVNHGRLLVKSLVMQGCRNVHFVKGGERIWSYFPSDRWSHKKTSIEKLADLVNDSDQIVIVGNVVLDEGIDIPSFNSLIMGTAMKKYRRSLQRTGRGMRPKPGDNKVYVFDLVDAHNDILLGHSQYRVRTYELEEYTFAPSLDLVAEELGCAIELSDDVYEWEDLSPERTKARSRRRKERQKRKARR